jgi:hypothetical protein
VPDRSTSLGLGDNGPANPASAWEVAVMAEVLKLRKLVNPEACTCDNLCPKEPCVCIYIHDTGGCICECNASATGGVGFLAGRGFPLDTLVSVSVRGSDLGRLGEFLSDLCDAELAIPASDMHKPVSLAVKAAELNSVIEEAGLIVLRRGPIQD